MTLPIITISVFLFLAVYLIYLTLTRSQRKNAAEIRRYGKETEKYIYSLLCRYTGKSNVINNLFLPVPTKEGIFDTEIDTLCITRGGIAVIETKGSKGLIESPESGKWCQRYKDKVMYFDNPYNQNRTHVRALQRVLDQHRLSRVHVYNLVVFADTSVQFTHEYPWLIRSDSLEKSIANIEKHNCLTTREINKIKRILKNYKKPQNKTFREKFRKRR